MSEVMTMNSHALRGSFLQWFAALALVAAAVAYGWRAEGSSASAAAAPPTQDVSRLESRFNQLEQRFRSIEMSISRLEQQQQSRLSVVTPGPSARGEDGGLLRAEIDALRRRLAEAECGLIRIDERTLTTAASDGRRKAGPGGTDPCRLNTSAPLNLSARP
jgi:hypothetical protein